MTDKPYWETPEYKLARERRERRGRLGEAELIHWFNQGRCPDCLGAKLVPGPRGGLSQNTHCGDCGSRFNVASFEGQVFFVERLDIDPPAGVQ
jgi:hypothetical protein